MAPQPNDISEVLAKAAREALPEHLSKELQTVITERDTLRERVSSLDSEVATLKENITRRLTELEEERTKATRNANKYNDLAAREADIATKEIDPRIRLAVQECEEKHTAKHVDMMQGVVAEVFSNNRFKYSESISTEKILPGVQGTVGGTDGNGCWHPDQPPIPASTVPVYETRTVEGEQ